MNKIINKLIDGLHEFSGSDLTCFIKFDQNKFDLIHLNSVDNDKINYQSIIPKLEQSDFANIKNQILDEFNLKSSYESNFLNKNDQYYLFCASFDEFHFNQIKTKVINDWTDSIKEIIMNEVESKYDSDNKLDQFFLVANAAKELIFTLDEYGNFTFINKYGLEQLKYNQDEVLGKHIYDFISDDYKLEIGKAFQEIMTNRKSISFSTEILPKVGIEQNFNIHLIPKISNEKISKIIGVGSNTSEKKSLIKKNDELLAKLKEANRINEIERDRAKQQISILNELNNLKNEFISNVSHELRTPLASIIGFSETILEDTSLTVERAKEFNDIILTESKRLAKLINDVLDFSELENARQQLVKKSINIIDILKNTIKNFEEECKNKKITLTNKIPDSEIIVFADQERIKKAFNYILSNAVKFTNENGRITLIAQEFLKEVEIVISDTGVGIPEQKVPLLFDKFSKVKRSGGHLPGAGFGLVTVKQIIDLHKGLIRVKSEVDKGTSFIIRLPKYSFN